MKSFLKNIFYSIVGPQTGSDFIYNLKVRKILANSLLNGKIGWIHKTISLAHEWYGDKEVGFFIYPKLLNKDSIIYSFGVGLDISFEQEVISKHQSQVFAFDPTPKSIEWLKQHNLPDSFKFYEYGLGAKNEDVIFYLPKNKNHVSGSIVVNDHINDQDQIAVPMKNWQTITDQLNHQKIDVLKMDIEGSEYDVLEDILTHPVIIDQILVEFHARYFEDGKRKTKEMIDLIKSHEYEIFGVSASMEEVSFIRKQSI